MLKNTLKGYLVVFLSKQININIMESDHLDFMSPANETPRVKNFDDVYLQLDREDALIVEEHIGNIPRVSFNLRNCLDFVKASIHQKLTDGNYEVTRIGDASCELNFGEISLNFFTYLGYFENSDLSIKTDEIQKAVFKEKTSKQSKIALQQEIDLLKAKMNAL
jgi:hypothetical protein